MSQYIEILRKNGEYSCYHHNCYESRGKSVESLIKQASDALQLPQNFNLIVGTDDTPTYEYNFSTISKNFLKCFPCFLFDKWPEVGIGKYDFLINSFQNTAPDSSKIGWIGAPMSFPRQKFCSQYGNSVFSEAIVNSWNRSDASNLHKNTTTYLTYQQQINKWKYLIDFEGAGYSGRTKVLLNSPRIIFIVDRIYEEFWYEYLEPWVHFVPVKRDLSDLEENYYKIENQPDLQNFIKQEQKQFAQKYLSVQSSYKQIQLIVENL